MKRKPLVATLFATLVGAAVLVFLPAPEQPVHGMGWVDDREARESVAASLPPGQKYFGETAAGRAFRADENKTVLLSDPVKAFLGKHIPTRNQGQVGSCVAFGTATAIEYLIALMAIEAGLPPESVKDLVQEAIYGLSRVEIGGGRIRGDGSVTAWAAQAVQRYGVLPRGKHLRYDLSRYDEPRCREWGRLGLPDDLEPIARQSPVRSFTFVRTADEAARALRQGYPIAQGSRVGFGNTGPHRRDADGFLTARGQWSHTMATIGVVAGKRPGFLILNSWGEDWIGGPTGGHDIPPGSFLVDWNTFDRMVREGDAVAFSDAVGFPAKDPFFLKNPVKAGREIVVGR